MDSLTDDLQTHLKLNASLCEPCRAVCSSQKALDELCSEKGYQRHGSIPQIQESAAKSCPLCIMLTDANFIKSDDPKILQVFTEPSDFLRNRKIKLRGQKGLSGFSRGPELRDIELWVDMISPYNDVLADTYRIIVHYQEDAASAGEMKESAEMSELRQKCLNIEADMIQKFTRLMKRLPQYDGFAGLPKPGESLVLRTTWARLMTLKASVASLPVVDTPYRCGNHIDSSPDSEPAWTYVKGWIEQCAKYPECEASLRKKLPKRLLRVGDGFNGVNLKLIETGGESGQYVALSYCWGGPQSPMTEKATIRSHLEKLDEKALPKTIQDAVIATRKLGFQYLWVDALCIIQDSDEDKVQEVTKMDEYYRNASLTIIAAGSANANEGFLQTQMDKSVSIPYIDQSTVLKMSHRIYDPDSLGGESDKETFESRYTTVRSPISKRAWTLQESTLSRRKLSYGTRRIDWICQHHRASWSGDGDSRTLTIARTSNQIPPPFDFFASSQQASEETLNASWASIVEEYTSRSLSVGEDKLPAISAIAKSFFRDSGRIYLAGLWKETIITDLLWWVDFGKQENNGAKAGSAKGWRAPSWSWACMDGKVTMGRADVQLGNSEFVTAAIDLKDAHAPFGRLQEGTFIILSGPLRRVDRSPVFQRADVKLDRDLPKDSLQMFFLRLATRDYDFVPRNELPVLDDDAVRTLSQFSERKDIAAGLAKDERTRERLENSEPEAVGLILVPTGQRGGEYRRAGVFLEVDPEAFGGVPISEVKIV